MVLVRHLCSQACTIAQASSKFLGHLCQGDVIMGQINQNDRGARFLE